MSSALIESSQQFSQLQKQIEGLSQETPSSKQQKQAKELLEQISLLHKRMRELIDLDQQAMHKKLLVPLLLDDVSAEIEEEIACSLLQKEEFSKLQVQVDEQYSAAQKKLQAILSAKVDSLASSFFSCLKNYALPAIGVGVGGVMVKMAYDATTAFVRDHEVELACVAGVGIAAAALYCYATASTEKEKIASKKQASEKQASEKQASLLKQVQEIKIPHAFSSFKEIEKTLDPLFNMYDCISSTKEAGKELVELYNAAYPLVIEMFGKMNSYQGENVEGVQRLGQKLYFSLLQAQTAIYKLDPLAQLTSSYPYVRTLNGGNCPGPLQSVGDVYTANENPQDLRRVLAIQLAVFLQQNKNSNEFFISLIGNSQLKQEASRVFGAVSQQSLENVLQNRHFMQVLYAYVLERTSGMLSDEEAMRFFIQLLVVEMGYQVLSTDSNHVELVGKEFGGTVPTLVRGIVKVDGNYYSVDSRYFDESYMNIQRQSAYQRKPGVLYAATGMHST
jgi:hypothetical protein